MYAEYFLVRFLSDKYVPISTADITKSKFLIRAEGIIHIQNTLDNLIGGWVPNKRGSRQKVRGNIRGKERLRRMISFHLSFSELNV